MPGLSQPGFTFGVIRGECRVAADCGGLMRTHTAAYGADANDRLRWLVGQAKRSDPLAPVTVIVPTNAAGVAARRLLASGLQTQTAGGSGIAGIAFVTVRGLGERLGAARLEAQGRDQPPRRSSPH